MADAKDVKAVPAGFEIVVATHPRKTYTLQLEPGKKIARVLGPAGSKNAEQVVSAAEAKALKVYRDVKSPSEIAPKQAAALTAALLGKKDAEDSLARALALLTPEQRKKYDAKPEPAKA